MPIFLQKLSLFIPHLQQLYLLHAVQPGLCVHHLKDLDLFERDRPLVVLAHRAVDVAELALSDLAVNLKVFEAPVDRVGGRQTEELLGSGSRGRVHRGGHDAEGGRADLKRRDVNKSLLTIWLPDKRK
jgi:hypothetical protein